MTFDTKVAILGAGKIGKAVYQILADLREVIEVETFVVDSYQDRLSTFDSNCYFEIDIEESTIDELALLFVEQKATHIINALPFFLNKKVASAAFMAGCSYIDFTEDDTMADAVQQIYKDSQLDCAVKCGLAPGFINYIGYDIVSKIPDPESLMVSVGALPRAVSFDHAHPEYSYNLTWSVDGLVNEYIRPCRVRKCGKVTEIEPLNSLVKVLLDGVEYEASHTSGGVGSLVRDLTHVPNVHYMTLRYPGHYKYVRSVIHETHGNFDAIRKIFLEKFPSTDDDVIVVYANAMGKDCNGLPIRQSYSNKFYGVGTLTGIQSTTAGSGVAILELILAGKLKGIVDHSTVSLADFTGTESFRRYYRTCK